MIGSGALLVKLAKIEDRVIELKELLKTHAQRNMHKRTPYEMRVITLAEQEIRMMFDAIRFDIDKRRSKNCKEHWQNKEIENDTL